MADDPTAGEVNRRVDRVERDISDALTEIKSQLTDMRKELQHQYVPQATFKEYRENTERSISDLQQRYDRLIARVWWLLGIVPAVVGAIVAVITLLLK